MVLLLLFCLLVGSSTAQFFECPPPNVTLNGNTGNSNCGDDGDPSQPCMVTVQPRTTCTFTILPGENTVSSNFGQLHIQAAGINSNDYITVLGAYDLVRNDILSPIFTLRSAFPYSGSQSVPFITVTVSAYSESTMQFGYYVQKKPVPAFNEGILLSVAPEQPAQFIKVAKEDEQGYFFEITANTSVVLAPSDVYQASSPASLINMWLYDGIGQDRQLIGTLYSSRQRVFSSGSSQMTVQYVLAPLQTYFATVVVNDAANTDQCTTYNVGWVQNQAESLFLENYPDGGTYCYTLLNYPIPYPYYLLDVKTSTPQEFQPIQLIAGGPVVDPVALQTLLTTYSSSIDYPPILTSSATTFIVRSNSSSVYLFFDTAAPNNSHVASLGKTGFITTPSYPNQNSLESVFFYMNGTSTFNTTLTVQNSMSPTAVLTVYGSSSVLYKGPVNNSWSQSFADKMIDFDIDLGLGIGGGVLMTYTVSEAAKPPLACPNGTASLQGLLSRDLTIVPANFECNFSFTFDANYFVDVSVQATNLSAGEIVQVAGLYDTIGNGASDSNFNLRAAFPPNTVTVYIKAGSTTSLRFGYSLQRRPMPSSDPTVVSLGALQDAFYIQMRTVSKNSSWEINAKASSQVSVISASPALATASDLLNFFVYEGTGPGRMLVGSLYQSYQKVWKSQGAAITVVYAQSGDLSTGAVIFNDAYNLESCYSYSAQWSYGNPTKNISTPDGRNLTIDVTVDAGQGVTACLTIIDDDSTSNDDPIFYDGYYSGFTYPQVFAGAPAVPFGNFPLRNLGSFFGKVDVGENDYFTLPQQFLGFARTIVLSEGLLQLATTTDPGVANLPRAYINRRGFVQSENYPFLSGSQDAAFSLRGDTSITVQFNIIYTNAPSGGSLVVYGEHGTLLTVNLTDPTATTTNYTASALVVGFALNGGDDPSNLNQGSLIRYQVVQSAQSSTTAAAMTTQVMTRASSIVAPSSTLSSSQFSSASSSTSQTPATTSRVSPISSSSSIASSTSLSTTGSSQAVTNPTVTTVAPTYATTTTQPETPTTPKSATMLGCSFILLLSFIL